jgi:glutathione S-transferase
MTMELFDNDMSTCAQKVRLLLTEKGASWTTHWLDLRAGDQNAPDYLKLNPAGVVPTLRHNGRVLLESNLILQYVDDAVDGPTFMPADPYARHVVRTRLLDLDLRLHGAVGLLSVIIAFRHDFLKKGPEAVAAYLASISDPERRARWREFIELGLDHPAGPGAAGLWRKTLQSIEAALGETKWLAADTYSLADIAYASYLTRLDHLGVLSALESQIPRTIDLYNRIVARPAYQQALAAHMPEKKVKDYRQSAAESAEQVRALLKV